MSYKVGDIVLVKFPFTNLKEAKKRPVLIVKAQNDLNDAICLQITSNDNQSHLMRLNDTDLKESIFSIVSYVKYDKCFTINAEIIDKKIAIVTENLLKNIKTLFCDVLF